MVNLPERSLCFLITTALNIEYGSDQFSDVFSASINHILCNTPITVYHRELAKLVDFKKLDVSPAKFRLALSDSGYVLKNLKYYAGFMALSHKRFTPSEAEYLYPKYDVCRCDAVWIFKSVNYSIEIRRNARQFTATKCLKRADYSVAEYAKLSVEFMDMFVPFMEHANRTVRKKLTFVKRHHNMTFDEFTSELTALALKAYYKSKPNNLTRDHQLNYLRRTVSSRTINLIEGFTAKKRARLVNMGTDNGDGAKFVQTVTAESQLPQYADEEAQSLEELGEGEFWLNASERQEAALSLERWLEKFGRNSQGKETKRSHIIRIFAGDEVPSFAKFLRERRMLRSDSKNSQDVFASRPHAEKLSLVCDYLNLTEEAVNIALRRCVNELGL